MSAAPAKVLVVDDERPIRKLLRMGLTTQGYEVLEAPDGRIGLDILRREPVDLVITDIMMPQMDGIETIREVRQRFPAIGIIAMSGGGAIKRNRIYLEAAAKLGAHRTLQKPFRAADLIVLVNDVLRLRQPRDRPRG